MLIQVRAVLEFPEHQVGDEHEDRERQVGPDEDPDLLSALQREKQAMQADMAAQHEEKQKLEASLSDAHLALERATAELNQKSVEIAEMAFLLDAYGRLRRVAERRQLPALKGWKQQLLRNPFRARK
jgi:DNA-directed RNA polymerase sigma subunit (sigma70/sigma32)